jgi:hypothetical protein
MLVSGMALSLLLQNQTTKIDMAKAPVKKTITTETTTAATRKPAVKKNTSAGDLIEKACQAALMKLKELDAEHQLQRDIEWCLGSYSYDKNPVGLLKAGGRALEVLKQLQSAKTKGITVKFIGDLEKAITTGA